MNSILPLQKMAPPSGLVAGTVRGWHILVLYGLVFVSMAVASVKLTQGMQADVRTAWKMLVMQGLTAALVAAFTVAVPELRRSLPALYARRRAPMEVLDVLLFASVVTAWTFGAHRLLLVFPLMHWDPSLIATYGYADHPAPPMGMAGLFVLLSVAFIAPVAEELVFRGYLLNLWMHRWGLWPGIAMSSVAFGAVHGHGIVFATAGGIFFCLAYLRFGSLWPGTLLHSVCNLVNGPFGLALLFLQKTREQALSLSAWIPEIALTAAFFPLAFLFWRRFRPAS